MPRKKIDPIDVEVTHVEENDEMIPLEDAVTRIMPVIEDSIRRGEQELAKRGDDLPSLDDLSDDAVSQEVAVQPDLLPVVANPDALDFQEDYIVLRVLYNKIFRQAILSGVELPDMPDIEGDAANAVADMTEVFNDLDDARDGKTDVDWRLSEWKKDLAS